ncbi:MAG TPA: type VI secretion system protein TssA [Paracoccaceae bacterium]|mgnify:CR=1 FL=1|nr:type VI secretion system protein TssA [Paracoccaceae bacterium]HMO71010.1 type VI secretion system protein TssA [Paracoccaceae bacterium]
MDFARLRISHGDDEPSGENLEYDPSFISLELAAQPGEERQVGDSIIAAEDPDHREVLQLSTELLERTHDIRAVAFAAYSLLRTEGFNGYREAVSFLRWMLEEHWATCHPQLDADDDDDPTMRINAVASIGAHDTMLKGLRLAPITESRAFGRFSLRDILIAEGEVEPPSGMDSPPEPSTISGAFQDSKADHMKAVRRAVDRIYEDVRAINGIFAERTPGNGPDLDDLIALVRQIQTKMSAYGIRGEDEEEADAVSDDTPGDAGDGDGGGVATGPAAGGGRAAGGGVSGVPGAINNQQDVKATLDKLIAYYQKFEPSSPVPMLLARCKRLVGADFLTIIKDIAPDGRDNAKMVGGIKDDDDDD